MPFEQNSLLKTAAIVCEHVALMKSPILSAFRTEPESLEDSGWQFFCGKEEEENFGNAQVWLLEEVLIIEPTLSEYMNLHPGVQVWRPAKNEDWIIRGELGTSIDT